MDLVQTQYRIREILGWFQNKVRLASSVGALDINKYAETMFIPLLKEVYGYHDLKNMNTEVPNFPAIDLGDEIASVGIQVTASTDSKKVKHTLQEFADNKLYEKYRRLVILILTEKQKSYSGQGYDKIIQNRFSFNKDRDIIDCRDVLRVIDSFELDRARRVLEILEAIFGEGFVDVSMDPARWQREVGSPAREVAEANIALGTHLFKLEDIGTLVQHALTLYSAQTSASQTAEIGAEDVAIQAKVEAARQLVQENNYVAAYTILLKLHNPEQLQQLSAALRFDIANLLGCCALDADDIAGAQNYFAEALQIDPTSVKALVNSSTVAVFAHDAERALELSSQACQLDPHNELVFLAHLQALYAAHRIAEIRQFLADEPDLAKSPRSAMICAHIEVEDGNYEAAAELIRKAAEAEPNNIDYLLMLASVLIRISNSDSSNNGYSANWRREKLVSAEDLLTLAVEQAQKENRNLQLRVALSNRSAVRSMLEQLEDALKDAERALSYDARDPNALENKGRILMRLGRPQEAALCFEALLRNPLPNEERHLRYVRITGDTQDDIRALLADAYLNAGQPEKVNEVLPTTPDFKVANEGQLGELELRLLASEELDDDLTVARIVERLEQDWPRSAIAKLILAGYQARQSDLDAAGRLLEEALPQAEGRLRDAITLQLAHIRFQEGNYAEAARLFAPHVDNSHDNPDLREYILSLYNSRQFPEALRLTAQIRAEIGPIAGISDIEASILEAGGNLDGARDVLQQLIDTQIDVLANQVHLAYIEYRRQNLDAAKQIVNGIPYDAVRKNARLLMNLARLRLLLDLPDVLEFAYQARRLDYTNPEMHVKYMMICLELKGSEAANVVAINTSVHVKRDDEITVFTILDERQVYHDRGELSVYDPLAKGLLGHHKGEHVVIDAGFMHAHEYEIVDIQTKYLWASHESTFMFGSGKLRNPAFEVVHMPPEKIAERFAEMLDRYAEHTPDVLELYYKHRLPLSMLAGFIKRHLVDIWLLFVEAPSERLMVASGSQADFQADKGAVANATEAALDLTAVLAIVELGLEAAVVNRFKRLLIAQGTIDELREYHHDLSTRPPSAFAGGSGEQRYIIEVPPEFVERRLTLTQKALGFIQAHAQVLPTMGVLELDPKLLESLGKSTAGSLILAKEQGCPLYSDDLHLRLLARAEWQRPGFDTQVLLLDLREQGALSDDEYYAGIKSLASRNYSFLGMTADSLMWALERSGMSISEDVRTMFRPLTDPDCRPASAADVLAQVIKRVWIGPCLELQRLSVLDLALDTLVTGRRLIKVLPLLVNALDRQFALIPLHHQQVLEAIMKWRQVRLL